jgi:hypothetical protein
MRKWFIAATFAAATMSAPVHADSMTTPGYVLIIHPDGMTTIGEVNAAATAAVLAQSKQLSDPVVLILSNGKAYLGGKPDTKMPDGTNMMDFITSNFCSDARHPGGCG